MFEPLQPIIREIENVHNKAVKNLATDAWSQPVHPQSHCRHKQEPDSLSFSNDIYAAKLDKQRESSWFPPLRIENMPSFQLPADPIGHLLETGAKNDAQLFSDLGHDFDQHTSHMAQDGKNVLNDLQDGNLPGFIGDVGNGLVDGIKDVGSVVGDIGGAIDRGLRSIFSFF